MRIFSGQTGDAQKVRQLRELDMGILLSIPPRSISPKLHGGIPISMDNGAYPAFCKGHGFNEYGFLKGLDYCARKDIPLQFVVCPDIVAGGVKSAEFSMRWRERLAGWSNLYFVAQDGMTLECIRECLPSFAGLFAGGTMEWKLKAGPALRYLATESEKPLHIGRVGKLELLKWAHAVGADSVDSTSFVRNGTFDIVRQYIRWEKENAHRHM
jgi:hypothetical protein